MGSSLVHSLHESGAWEQLGQLAKTTEFERRRLIGGLVWVGELQHRRDDRIEGRRSLRRAPDDDPDPAPRPEDSMGFLRDQFRMSEDMETEPARHEVERLVGEV